MKKTSLFWVLTMISMVFTQKITAQSDNFTWDNASVYFVMTDRFYDGDPSNNNSYGRGFDGNGNAYTGNDAGMFHGGDIKGMTQKIQEGYFDQIGVNAIWITAPYEQMHGWVGGGPAGDFAHYPYHGYYTLDWSEMDKNMGSEAEFQAFVDEAHAHGIRVIMDIVLNHTGYVTFKDMEEFNFGSADPAWKGWRPSGDQNWHSYHDLFMNYGAGNNWGNFYGTDWMRHPDVEEYDDCQTGGGLTNCVGFLPDIKTESIEEVGIPPILITKWTREGTLAQKQAELDAWFVDKPRIPHNYIIFWLKEWVRKYGIDGFRVDTAKHVELDVWEKLKNACVDALREWKTNNPDKAPDDQDFWMTAEVWNHGKNKSPYHDKGFNSVINFNLKNDARLGRNTSSLESLFSEYADVNKPAADGSEWNVLSYLSSHDVTPLFPREQLAEVAPAFMLLPGGVQIFYGDEAKRPEGTYADEEQNTRSDFDWNNIDNRTFTVFGKLGRFRKNHPAVGGGTHTKIADAPYTFVREYENADLKIYDKVAVTIGSTGTTTIDVSGVFEEGEIIVDAYSGGESTVTNGQVTFTADSEGIILMEYKNPPAYQIRPVVSILPNLQYSPDPITVTISATDESDANPTVYYSLDENANPANLNEWTVYTSGIQLTEPTTVKSFAINSSGAKSNVVTRKYHVGAIEPFTVYCYSETTPSIYVWDALPEGISPDMTWPGVAMTRQGTSNWYSYQIDALSANIILLNGSQSPDMTRDRNGWYKDGQWFDSCPEGCPGPQVPAVTILPEDENHPSESVLVSISATESGVIYYTTDGSTPNQSSAQYTGAFTLTGTAGSPKTVKAIAYNDLGSSTVVSKTFTFEPQQTMTLYWKAPCSNPTVYFWAVEGGTASTTWPGEAMTDTDGDGWYEYTLEAECSNIIFSCSGGSQTPDLNICAGQDSWYDGGWQPEPGDEIAPNITMTASANFDNSMSVTISATDNEDSNPTIYYTTDGTEPSTNSASATSSVTLNITETTTVKAFSVDASNNVSTVISETYTENGSGFKVYFYTNFANPTVYFWGGSATTTWPGESMTDEGNGWFSYFLPDGCTNLIFSNNGASQSPDLQRCEEGWFYQNAWHATNPLDFSGDLVVHFKPVGYTNPKVYFWNLTGNSTQTTTWPGENMVSEGNGWYNFTFNQTACANIIFSNNGGNKTADLSVCQEGWYTNGSWSFTNSSARIEKADFGLTNYPNPFSQMTNIRFNLLESGYVNVTIFDAQGKVIEVLNDGDLQAGRHLMLFDGSKLNAGLYFCKMNANGQSLTQKLMIIK